MAFIPFYTNTSISLHDMLEKTMNLIKRTPKLMVVMGLKLMVVMGLSTKLLRIGPV